MKNLHKPFVLFLLLCCSFAIPSCSDDTQDQIEQEQLNKRQSTKHQAEKIDSTTTTSKLIVDYEIKEGIKNNSTTLNNRPEAPIEHYMLSQTERYVNIEFTNNTTNTQKQNIRDFFISNSLTSNGILIPYQVIQDKETWIIHDDNKNTFIALKTNFPNNIEYSSPSTENTKYPSVLRINYLHPYMDKSAIRLDFNILDANEPNPSGDFFYAAGDSTGSDMWYFRGCCKGVIVCAKIASDYNSQLQEFVLQNEIE